MTPAEFITWAASHGLPKKLTQQLIRVAASPEDMEDAFETEMPPPPIFPLENIVSMNDKDEYKIAPLENGFMLVGDCPNGDLIAIDLAEELGSVWYISHERMFQKLARESAIRVTNNVVDLLKGLEKGDFPYDYHQAKEQS